MACEEAKEKYRLEANDLIQQRRSADAAEAMTILTYQQTRIASWGVALGFITMAAAIAAAYYARGAATHTDTANAVARGSQRAWVVIEPLVTDVKIEKSGINLRWECKFINKGKTIAREVSAQSSLEILNPPDFTQIPRLISRLRDKNKFSTSIIPGEFVSNFGAIYKHIPTIKWDSRNPAIAIILISLSKYKIEGSE